jgi:hypothetical protein
MKNASEHFGPFLEVPSGEIWPAGFTCARCNRPVRKWPARYFAEAGDCMLILSCKCVSAGCWELENPPRNSEQWSRLVRMARKNKCEFVSLSPKGAAILYGHAQN